MLESSDVSSGMIFPDILPELHSHWWFENHFKTNGHIVLTNNPDIFYIKPEDSEKLKSLTGIEDCC